ncbi:MAG: hypothetical protein QOD98_2937, partial [Nocardioidaceae bacterium]|nr:hypothetical protein [Nocardioidaceae bacterium]
MDTVPREPAPTRHGWAARGARLPLGRRLAGVLTGLGVLPLLTLGLNALPRDMLTLASQMLLYLIAVMLVGLVGGLLPALAAALAAAALLAYYFIAPLDVFAIADPNNVVALVAFLVAATVSSLVALAARRTQAAETLVTAIAQSREELRVLAAEQASLRRVATLVARGVPPAESLAAVAQEVGSVLGADATGIARLDPDGMATVVARVGELPRVWPLGSRSTPEPALPLGITLTTGRPSRRDDDREGFGPTAEAVRELGIQSVVAAPIVVEGRLWGTIGILGRS